MQVEKHGGWTSFNVKFKQKNPEKYKEILHQAGKIGGRKASETHRKNKTNFFDSEFQREMGRRGAKRMHQLYPELAHEVGLKSLETLRKNSPYWFLQIPFDSATERKIAKLLLFKFGIVPEERDNIHIKMNGGEIDGCLWNIIFWEFHPKCEIFKSNRIYGKKYYNLRRKILDKNGHKDKLLFIMNSQEGIKTLEKFLVDFKLEM